MLFCYFVLIYLIYFYVYIVAQQLFTKHVLTDLFRKGKEFEDDHSRLLRRLNMYFSLQPFQPRRKIIIKLIYRLSWIIYKCSLRFFSSFEKVIVKFRNFLPFQKNNST